VLKENATKTKDNPEKASNTKYSKTINTQTYKNAENPLDYCAVTRGWLPQRARSPSLNGGGAAATVPSHT